METYTFICPVCKEEHQLFTGRMTFGTPAEIDLAKQGDQPHPSVFIINDQELYIKGIIKIPFQDYSDGYIIENWMPITTTKWRTSAETNQPLEGKLLFQMPLFQISKDVEWQVGFDEENDEFQFLVKETFERIKRWQIEGIDWLELQHLYANQIHNPDIQEDDTIITSSLKEATDYLLSEDKDYFIHAVLDNQIIFQMLNTENLELIQSSKKGVGIDIPIDESVTDNFRDQILKFSKLKSFKTDIVNDIRIYQYDYKLDYKKLQSHIDELAEECYGIKSSEIEYHVNEMLQLKREI